jgi:hypothetical protein
MNLGMLVALTLAVPPAENAKSIVDNEQVAVWDVTWGAGQTSTRWDQDTLIVFLGSGSIETAGADGVAHAVTRKPGDVEFVPRGTARSQRVGASQGMRAILIQQKVASPPPLANTSGLPDAFDRPGIVKALQNEHLDVWRYTWEPGKPTPKHFHARDVVVVYLTDGVLRSVTPDGKSALNPFSFGLSKFNNRGRIHYEELADGKATAVLVELK